jgi:hypothetical protein
MSWPEHLENRHGVIMWERGAMVCTALILAPNRIDIILTLNGVIVQREFFPDSSAASDFAIDKMHEYGDL